MSYYLQNRAVSVKTIFVHLINLHGCPSQNFLKMMSAFCSDIEEKDQLVCLSTSESDYNDHIVKNHKNYFDIFCEYSTCKPPLQHLLQYCDVMKERFYSISSSPRVEPDYIELSLNLVSTSLPSKNFQGLCSHWLHAKCISENNLLHFQVKPSEQFIHLRNLGGRPFIVCCHGTSMFYNKIGC